MRRRGLRTLLTGVVTIALAAGSPAVPGWAAPTAAGATAPAAGSPSAGSPSAPRDLAPKTFTLITGDRVTVRPGSGGVSVEAGPGRAGMRFASQTVQGHRYVIPADAIALLRQGRVDRRLFDVTVLAEFGYDDRAGALPLLVSYPVKNRGAGTAARSASTVGGARIVRDLPVVGALAVHADRAGRTALWDSLTAGAGSARSLAAGVDRISLDGKRRISLDVSVPQIGAPQAWQAGLDGTGVTVAVLDTGVDATHPDLAGRIAGSKNFTETPDTDDTVGHGTHVASTIAGTGAASAGRYRGVAPGAKLLIGKVCESEFCDDSAILAGMTWAAPQAQVINLSLGGRDAPTVDPLEQAVTDLTAAYGTLFVIAAGNEGGDATVGSPASADAALAVGAVDRENQLADFSSRGPRVGDDAVKPDVTAPGVDITAAKAAHGYLGEPAGTKGYTTMSGTSMATPHAAGAAAILVQQHPDWTPRQRKAALMGSARLTPGVGVFAQGAGRIDVARAITQTVTAEQGSLSFGRQLWPHGDDAPVTRTVTYHNSGTTPVTLSLTVHATAPGGAAAPAGVFTLGAATLTVPAGGRADTTLTANTRVAGPDGLYGGHLTAVGPQGVQVQTPFGINREVESYNVKLVHTDRDGTPAEDFLTVLTNLDTFAAYDIGGPEATATVRLPKATYGLFSWIFAGAATEDTADDQLTMLVQPKISITGPVTIRLDARQGRPVRVRVPRRDATPTLIAANAEWTGDNGGLGASALVDRFESLYTAQIGPNRAVAGFTASLNASFARRTGESFRNSPYTYDLVWFSKGRMFTGFTRSLRARDLATIKAAYATEATGVEGVKFSMGRLSEEGGGWGVLIPFDLPFRRTEYVNTDGGVRWSAEFNQQLRPVDEDAWPEAISGSGQELTRYRGGRTYREDWNRAVFGPSVAHSTAELFWAARAGDMILAGVPLFAEGTGRIGWSLTDKARTALYSGGRLIGENAEQWGEFTVPAGPATYRLETSAERGAPHTLSTRVAGTWTFRSRHVAGEQPQRLPLSTVRFSPRLDQRNAAPAGRRFDVPLTVERQGAGAGRVRRITVDVSYDDGRTWRHAQVRGSGQSRVATVRHPKAAGFASLRVSATDTAGNTVTQTIVRAYRIG